MRNYYSSVQISGNYGGYRPLLERSVTQIAVKAEISNVYASLHSRRDTVRLDQNELGTNGRRRIIIIQLM